jgi:hypothetical protein
MPLGNYRPVPEAGHRPAPGQRITQWGIARFLRRGHSGSLGQGEPCRTNGNEMAQRILTAVLSGGASSAPSRGKAGRTASSLFPDLGTEPRASRWPGHGRRSCDLFRERFQRGVSAAVANAQRETDARKTLSGGDSRAGSSGHAVRRRARIATSHNDVMATHDEDWASGDPLRGELFRSCNRGQKGFGSFNGRGLL